MHNVIVDGYNVLHADADLKKRLGRDLQGARNALVRRVLRYLERKRLRITLVFDGRGGVTGVDTPLPGKLQVLFSRAGQTADELILETLRGSPNPRAFTVVTSDMTHIGREARSLGAEVLPSTGFLERIGEPGPRNEPAGPADGVAGDIDYWLEKFENRGKNENGGD